MKKIIYLTSCIMLLAAACNNEPKVSGINLSDLDTTVRPTVDFYQYACGGWMEKNPLQPEYARYGSFDKLAEDNVKQVNGLITDIAEARNEPGSVADKIATFYNVGMDSTKLNQQGAQPVSGLLTVISEIKDKTSLDAQIISLHKNGIYPFFGLFSEADFTNSSMNIGWIYQTGINMGDRDYYLENDAHTKEIREKYEYMLTNMFRMSGYDKMVNQEPEILAAKVLALETRLAKGFMSRHDLRDPYKSFNKKEVSELQALSPAFNFTAYFNALGLPDITSLNVAQPDYIKTVNNVLETTNIEDMKAYLAWSVINTASSCLSDDFVNESFDFYGRVLSGRQELQPRWKRVVNKVNGALGEAVGQLYVAKYFPAKSKENMLHLVENLQTVFGERIQSATWMDEATKTKALDKLHSFRVKIGYPDKWRDYSALEVKTDSYFENMLRSNRFDIAHDLEKIDKPKDVTEWGMTPQTVNAYYNPTTNEICFPAGILQPPFYYADADDAVNYGAIGVVIGHEMTHGFDNQGRQYDQDGNLKDWWQPADAENFKVRAQVLVDYFNTIEVAPGVKADGVFTLGENIADNGGIQISFQAMGKAKAAKEINDGKMDGFTPEQRFFLAYARVWAGSIRDQEILRRTKEDPHSLGKWRVDGTLPHIEGFIKAFHVEPGDAMYLAPDQRAQIW
jgi:putative endopeptidase